MEKAIKDNLPNALGYGFFALYFAFPFRYSNSVWAEILAKPEFFNSCSSPFWGRVAILSKRGLLQFLHSNLNFPIGASQLGHCTFPFSSNTYPHSSHLICAIILIMHLRPNWCFYQLLVLGIYKEREPSFSLLRRWASTPVILKGEQTAPLDVFRCYIRNYTKKSVFPFILYYSSFAG